jgi:hypothetical protein
MDYTIQYGSQVQDRDSHRYIFVGSHMRSFSSLLCHVLGSHREIDGYAETHDARQLIALLSGHRIPLVY